MAIWSLVNLLRFRRQAIYGPSMSRFVNPRILRAMVVSLMPVNRAICRKLLPFSRYIVIRILFFPLSRFSLLSSKSIWSRCRFLASSVSCEIFMCISFINFSQIVKAKQRWFTLLCLLYIILTLYVFYIKTEHNQAFCVIFYKFI